MSSEVCSCSCLGIWFFLDSTTSAEKKSCSLESRDILAKLGISLNIFFFVCHIDVLWVLIKRINSGNPCKIKYCGKDSAILLKYLGVPFWYLLASRNMMAFFWQKGVYSSPVTGGVLVNSWISWDVH